MNKTLTSLTRVILLAMALPLAAAGSAKSVRPPKASKAKVSAPSHAINLNSATMTELMQLPKIGAKTAERIITFRKAHGGFRRSEELMNVKGIGEKSYQKLQPFLSVGAAASSPVTVATTTKMSHPKHAAAVQSAAKK